MRDQQTRDAIAALHDVIDTDEVDRKRGDASHRKPQRGNGDTPVWATWRPARWKSARPSRAGLLALLISGGWGVGDPACDVMAAWLLLPAKK